MSAMIVNSVPVTISASSAPTPADGSVDRIVIGMDVAFVQHPEDDVDRDHRGQNEQGLVAERRLKRLCGPLEIRFRSSPAARSAALTWSTAVTALPSEAPGARLNEKVTTGNCPW